MNLNKEYLNKSLSSGVRVFDKISSYLKAFESDAEFFSLSGDDEVSFPGSIHLHPESDDFLGILKIMKIHSDPDDQILYFFGDSPYIDFTLSCQMLERHNKYYADYSFADGYPLGWAPEIINGSLISRLLELEQGSCLTNRDRDAFFTLIQKDINSFDIETSLCPVDFRSRRLQLFVNEPQNILLCEKLASVPQDKILETLDGNIGLDRTLPVYFSIQINSGCPQACRLCPYPQMNSDLLKINNQMNIDDFSLILEKINQLNPYAYISLSPWGEPALHKNLSGFIRRVMSYPHFRLIIETSGLGWDRKMIENTAAEIKDQSRFFLILSLDAQDPELYKSLRGEGFDQVQKLIPYFEEAFKKRFWIQAVRSTENEEHLESFYRYWKDRKSELIIQKYDSFCGRLPNLTVTDLTPLEREPCWHLKRDITILLDGSVPVCREDTFCENKQGNFLKDDPEKIWAAGESLYKKHCEGEFPEICGKCDEYYTFNF